MLRAGAGLSCRCQVTLELFTLGLFVATLYGIHCKATVPSCLPSCLGCLAERLRAIDLQSTAAIGRMKILHSIAVFGCRLKLTPFDRSEFGINWQVTGDRFRLRSAKTEYP